MPLSLPPCPECKGERAFFKGASPAILFRPFMTIEVYGYTCLACGHTSLRIHPDDLKLLHEAAEKALAKAPHPCPECAGERVFLKRVYTENPSVLSLGIMNTVYLYACICLQCGYTTERPLPQALAGLRKSAANKYSRFL